MNESDEEKAAQADVSNQVSITPTQAYCGRHGEVFRAEWPKGAIFTQVKMFERLIGVKASKELSEQLWAEAARLLGRTDTSEPLPLREGLEALLNKKPMCCRLGDKVMRKLYDGAGIGTVGRCQVCKRKNRKCVPIQARSAPGVEPHTMERVCFDCVLRGLRNAPPQN